MKTNRRTAFLASSVLPAEQVSGGYNIRDDSDEVKKKRKKRRRGENSRRVRCVSGTYCCIRHPQDLVRKTPVKARRNIIPTDHHFPPT